MATDRSEPQVGLIAKVGLLSVVVLFATRGALGAYFDHEVQAQEHAKMAMAKPEALMSLRTADSARLSGGSMPIDKAMAQLSTKGRMGVGPDLVPNPSKDLAPLQGWSKMPAEVPPGALEPPPALPPPSLAALPDGGAGGAVKVTPLPQLGGGKQPAPAPAPGAPRK